jgi:hypothetical protein
MLEPTQAPVFGEGDTSFRPTPWRAPATVPEDVRREAIHGLGMMKTRNGAPTMTQVEQFVAYLANVCAGSDLPPETKLKGVVSLILWGDYPAVMFLDRAFYDRAARRFKFWPSWAELAPVLDEERERLRVQDERLCVIAKGGEPAPRQRREEPKEPWTGPRRLSAETEAMLEQWRRNPPPLPEMRRPHPAAAGPSGRNAMR